MKLISMSDFILENEGYKDSYFKLICLNYAKFLKTPLAEGMLIGKNKLLKRSNKGLSESYFLCNNKTIEDLIIYTKNPFFITDAIVNEIFP